MSHNKHCATITDDNRSDLYTLLAPSYPWAPENAFKCAKIDNWPNPQPPLLTIFPFSLILPCSISTSILTLILLYYYQHLYSDLYLAVSVLCITGTVVSYFHFRFRGRTKRTNLRRTENVQHTRKYTVLGKFACIWAKTAKTGCMRGRVLRFWGPAWVLIRLSWFWASKRIRGHNPMQWIAQMSIDLSKRVWNNEDSEEFKHFTAQIKNKGKQNEQAQKNIGHSPPRETYGN